MRAIPPKIYILKFVGEQGIVSVDDVTRHLFYPDNYPAVRLHMHRLGLAHDKCKGVKHGVWFIDRPELLELLNAYFPELPLFDIHSVPVVQYLHYIELNKIRTVLQKSNRITVDEWWSENYIRALAPSIRTKFCTPQIPDAIFWRKSKDGTRQHFFLEFERTLKAKDRYEDIFSAYAKRQDVQKRNVLYICQTQHIREELLSIEARMVKSGKLEGANLYFQFVTLASFYKTYENQSSNKEGVSNENDQTISETASI